MTLPRLIVTGASGFVGRHLLEATKYRYRIIGMARRSQPRSGAPVHPNIRWFQVDIADKRGLADVFRRIGGVAGDIVVHLAAHYDFTGEPHEEYQRTNIDGLRNVLDLCRETPPRQFVFSSSVAACAFPEPGQTIDEFSAADGEHIYARSKRVGEEMIREYLDAFPATTVRFAAMFSDWCEYPPLFMFFKTWLSDGWNSRVLGGRGHSAIPYLHVRDAVSFLQRVLEREELPESGEVLVASPDGAVSHLQLFNEATREWFDEPRDPIRMPRILCKPGMWFMLVLGRILGNVPFERPWMADYIDEKLTIDAALTRRRLDWAPRPRLEVLRRLPLLLVNLRIDPAEWFRRNRAAMKQVELRPSLAIHSLLKTHEPAIAAKFTARLTTGNDPRFEAYRRVSASEHRWNHRVVVHQLMTTVLTRQRTVFLAYCRDLADRRWRQGYRADDVTAALLELDRIIIEHLEADPESADVRHLLREHISMTIRYGADQVEDAFEELEETSHRF